MKLRGALNSVLCLILLCAIASGAVAWLGMIGLWAAVSAAIVAVIATVVARQFAASIITPIAIVGSSSLASLLGADFAGANVVALQPQLVVLGAIVGAVVRQAFLRPVEYEQTEPRVGLIVLLVSIGLATSVTTWCISLVVGPTIHFREAMEDLGKHVSIGLLGAGLVSLPFILAAFRLEKR